MSGGEPIQVLTKLNTHAAPPDPDCRHLQQWVASNQSGWSHVHATNPDGGVFVSLGKARLPFVGSTVFALTDRGMFSKPIRQGALTFLVNAGGT